MRMLSGNGLAYNGLAEASDVQAATGSDDFEIASSREGIFFQKSRSNTADW